MAPRRRAARAAAPLAALATAFAMLAASGAVRAEEEAEAATKWFPSLPDDPGCTRDACESFADDCCAPGSEEFGCTRGLVPVKTEQGCSMYDEGDFVCCTEGYTRAMVDAAGVNDDDTRHHNDGQNEGECSPEWVGGFECVAASDCESSPFTRIPAGACYTQLFDDEICCGRDTEQCCTVEAGPLIGLIVGLVVAATAIGIGVCACTKTCCFRRRAPVSLVPSGGVHMGAPQGYPGYPAGYPAVAMAPHWGAPIPQHPVVVGGNAMPVAQPQPQGSQMAQMAPPAPYVPSGDITYATAKGQATDTSAQ